MTPQLLYLCLSQPHGLVPFAQFASKLLAGHQPFSFLLRGVREPIEKRRCEVLYLELYSADLDPLEEASSTKIESILPKAEARAGRLSLHGHNGYAHRRGRERGRPER